MKLSAALILILNTVCVLSQISHDFTYFWGCFLNSTTQVQYRFDSEEIFYVNIQRKDVVYTVPPIIDPDPNQLFGSLGVLEDALAMNQFCPHTYITYMEGIENHPTEKKDPPEILLFPSERVVLGLNNSLICFVNHFYPPSINVSWTKNGLPVSVEVSLSRYHPNNDQTFHQFSTLTFTPSEGDIYSCTVEHTALDTPKTRIWETEFPNSHQSLGADFFCGVGLSLGLSGVATGVFLFAKGHQDWQFL